MDNLQITLIALAIGFGLSALLRWISTPAKRRRPHTVAQTRPTPRATGAWDTPATRRRELATSGSWQARWR